MWLYKSKFSWALVVWAWLMAFPAHAERAIWMWEADSFAMLENAQVADDNIAFLRAKGIRTLYLYADAYQGRHLLAREPQRYAHLIQRLHAQGMQVYALLGSWHLHTERYVLPEFRPQALQMLQQVLDYNAKATDDAKFDGVNLDIEPHILDQWDTRRIELLEQFVDLSHAFMALKRRSNQSLKIGPAIPFWLDGIPLRWGGVTKPTSEHVQDIYDYVALMDYRDRADGPDGILSHAKDEMAYARKIGKTVLIGIETGPNEIQKVSFNHLRETDMERELGKVRQALASEPTFGGFVIHHFRTYWQWVSAKP